MRRAPSSAPNPPLFEGETWGPTEDAIATRIMQGAIATANKNQSDGLIRRDAHPKQHGCVSAVWKTGSLVKDVGPQAGLFSQAGSEYKAWIRFSNGSPTGAHAKDGDADVRGMAIKLMGVPNTPQGSQDFVLMTSAEFFSKNAADYMDFNNALGGGKLTTAKYMITHPTNAFILLGATVKPRSPLEVTYFSPVPSRIGESSMRYKVEPCGGLPAFAKSSDPDFLRQALTDTLAKKEACFDFFVQINENPARNNIEDPTLKWDVYESPYIYAGHITIPRQTNINTPAQRAFCENVSFNPWNSQEELRPLGQINRIRKIVYDGMSEYRHQANHVKPAEPINTEPCETESSASLCVAHP